MLILDGARRSDKGGLFSDGKILLGLEPVNRGALVHKPDGTVVEAYWLTNFPSSRVGVASLFHMAKSRWEIENQGFNEAKSRHGLEHICHHQANSLLITWLLIMLALTIERLYRLRYLHRGTHVPLSGAELFFMLWINLFRPCSVDTS